MYPGQKINHKGLPAEIISIEYILDKITAVTIRYEGSGRTISLTYEEYREGLKKTNKKG